MTYSYTFIENLLTEHFKIPLKNEATSHLSVKDRHKLKKMCLYGTNRLVFFHSVNSVWPNDAIRRQHQFR